jgi:predicted PurR-regulated permease PerM
MKAKDKIILYLIFTILFLAFIYAIKSILIPFISAIIIAYFLDPLADRLEKFGLSRTTSASTILGVFLISISLLFILVLPLLYSQMLSLFAVLPGYINIVINEIYPQIYQFTTKHGFVLEPDIHNYLTNENLTNMFGFSGTILDSIMQSGVVLFNVISLIFITPVLVFYMLRDWDLLVKQINKYLPSNHGKEIRNIFKDIDTTLSGYVHGQFNVCIILGILYAISLSILGLNFGFLIGFLTGFLSFIPYIGMLLGVSAAIIISLFQWGFDSFYISLVLVIFLTGQVFESNFLTPKLVGDKIGLHAVWIIFGLFVFGVLFGFIGVLLAMPATAICGVLIKFLALQYKKHFVG